MKILLVNKFYYLRGGAEKYFLEQEKALKAMGHEVAVFSMEHPKNLPSPYSKYFVSRLSFNEATFRDKLKTPGRVLYSLEAKRKFTKLLKDFKPDIIHLHNIYHQISPSILPVAKKQGIAVVMHLHDYKLICPNYQLLNHGEICQRCRGGNYFEAAKTSCFKDSFAQSLLVSTEMYLHHKIMKIYEKNVNLYIAPSNFMKETCVDFGVDKNKIKVLLNFTEEKNVQNNLGNYYLYFGRLAKEKGLEVLLKTGLRIKVVGTGAEKDSLETKYPQAEFLGFKSGRELEFLIVNSRAIVIPSIWLENMPFSMLEAISYGKVVVASDIGGMPEILGNGAGYLFPTGDTKTLKSLLESLQDSDLVKASEKALKLSKDLNIDKHLKKLVDIYKEILD